jgi:hypothetical protein
MPLGAHVQRFEAIFARLAGDGQHCPWRVRQCVLGVCETHERPRLSQDERFGLRTRSGLTQQLSLLLARAAAAGLSLASTELFLLRLMTTFLQSQEPSPTLVPLIKSADQTSSGTTETTGTMHSLQ